MKKEQSLNRNTSLYRWASILALITIFYNILEGLVSVWFGFTDDALALFGFGLDSFVEVISGIGIWHMINRLRDNPDSDPDRFEKTALYTTASAFYLLSVGLTITALVNLYYDHRPETSFWGVVVSVISISVMWILIHYKTRVGRELHSEAILADAQCSKVCMWLSVVLLLSSLGYELTGIGIFDGIGTLLIAWFSFREGKESWKAAAERS